MNKTASIVGGLIIVVLAITVFVLATRGQNPALTANDASATSTPAGEENPDAVDTTASADTEDLAAAPPVATTNATVVPTDTTVVVTGTVNPNGASTDYWYEYGVGTSMGKQTAKQTVGSGRTAILAPGYITGLTKSTTYYYRLVAQSAEGKSTGEQESFRTSGVPSPTPTQATLPTAKTFPADGITRTGAALRGEVNPNGGVTQYWFEYGRSKNLGNTTAIVSVGNGTQSSIVSAQPKLTPNTTYFFRMNAQNEFGTVNGTVMTFTTSK